MKNISMKIMVEHTFSTRSLVRAFGYYLRAQTKKPMSLTVVQKFKKRRRKKTSRVKKERSIKLKQIYLTKMKSSESTNNIRIKSIRCSVRPWRCSTPTLLST